MYKKLLITPLFLLITSLLLAQTKQLVLRTGLDFNFADTENESLASGNTISSTSANGVRFLLNNGVGYLKDGKRFTFVGLITGYDHSVARDVNDAESKTNKYTLGTVIGRQNFIELAPRLYYTNNVFLLFEYSRARNTSDLQPGSDLITKQYFTHLDIRPIGVAVKVKPRLMTCANFGNIRAGYLRTVEWREHSEGEARAKDRTFSVETNPHFITFGILFFLNAEKPASSN